MINNLITKATWEERVPGHSITERSQSRNSRIKAGALEECCFLVCSAYFPIEVISMSLLMC